MAYWGDTVYQDAAQQHPYAGVTVIVRPASNPALLATITDSFGNAIVGSQLTTSILGFAEFYADSGSYLLEFVVNGTTKREKVVTIGGPLEDEISSSGGASLVGFGIRTVADVLGERVSVLQYIPAVQHAAIIAGTSTYDASTDLQTWVDANKGKHLVIPHIAKRINAAGLLLDGSTYNGTRIDIEGTLLLKPSPGTSGGNFQSALWGGIIVRKADSVSINMLGAGVFDGNMTNQPAYEQIHCLVLAGATRFASQRLAFRDIAGDGVFIGMSTLSSNPGDQQNSDGFTVGELVGWNTTKGRGRNLLSVTSGVNGRVGSVDSFNVGGVVGGVFRMPGGVDLESDFDWQLIDRWVFGSVKVVSQGLSGFSVNGRAGHPATNVEVGSLQVINDLGPDGTVDGAGNPTLANVSLLSINEAANVRISNYEGLATAAYAGLGVVINSSDRVYLKGSVSHVAYGLRGGQDFNDSIYGAGMTRSEVDLDVSDLCREGFFLGEVTDCRIKGKVTDPKTGYFPAGLFAVNVSGGTVTSSKLTVDVPYSANWNRTYRNSGGATLTGTVICDCAMLGAWPYDDKLIGDVVVPRHNVVGITDANLDAGAPFGTTAYWKAGQVVRNNTGTVGKPLYYTFTSGGAWVAGPNL